MSEKDSNDREDFTQNIREVERVDIILTYKGLDLHTTIDAQDECVFMAIQNDLNGRYPNEPRTPLKTILRSGLAKLGKGLTKASEGL